MNLSEYGYKLAQHIAGNHKIVGYYIWTEFNGVLHITPDNPAFDWDVCATPFWETDEGAPVQISRPDGTVSEEEILLPLEPTFDLVTDAQTYIEWMDNWLSTSPLIEATQV